jgi:hypothetical protein
MAKVNTLLRPDVPLVPGFGRWQQNWNHLNWVQQAIYNCMFFNHKRK